MPSFTEDRAGSDPEVAGRPLLVLLLPLRLLDSFPNAFPKCPRDLHFPPPLYESSLCIRIHSALDSGVLSCDARFIQTLFSTSKAEEETKNPLDLVTNPQ